jgi:hypothetical protein
MNRSKCIEVAGRAEEHSKIPVLPLHLDNVISQWTKGLECASMGRVTSYQVHGLESNASITKKWMKFSVVVVHT